MEKNIKNESIKINFIFNIIYQVIVVISPLILTPKLSRVFGADYLGIKGYTFSIVYYFAIFGLLGLDMLGQRKVALVKDDLDKRSNTFWTIFITRFILVGVSLSLYILYFNIFSSDNLEKIVFICWIFYLVREMINPIWFLQGIEKYRLLSILNILSQVLYVVFTFVFVNSRSDLPLYVILFTTIPLGISLCYFPVVFKYTRFVKIKMSEMLSSVKESIVYFIPSIATAIYSMIDKTMLGVFDSSKIWTGLYESAEKIAKVAIAFSTASYTIIRTRMSYLFGKNDKDVYNSYCEKFISFSMMLCWPIMFGIIGITKDFVPVFFGDGFEEVVNLTYVFSLVVPCLSISGLIQAIYIFPYGLQRTMDKYYVIIVAVNILMNGILIFLLGPIGAVVSSVFSEALLAFILILRARRDIKVKSIFWGSVKYFISSIIMLVIIVIISKFLPYEGSVKIIIEVISGMVIYFIACLVMRDKFVISNSLSMMKKIGKVFRGRKSK